MFEESCIGIYEDAATDLIKFATLALDVAVILNGCCDTLQLIDWSVTKKLATELVGNRCWICYTRNNMMKQVLDKTASVAYSMTYYVMQNWSASFLKHAFQSFHVIFYIYVL